MATISTNDKTLAQLIEIANQVGAKVYVSPKLPLAVQRQKVIDAIRARGAKIENTLFVRA